nr:hypothetical protein [Tanacetum cinerariifolium]
EKEGKKKTASAKQPKPMLAIEKSTKPTPAPKPKVTKERLSKACTAKPPKPKPTKEKSTKTTPPQKAGKGKIAKGRKVKSPFQVVDEPDEEPAQSEPEPKLKHQDKGDEDDMELAIQMSLESIQAQSQAHVGGVAIREPIAEATQPLPVVEGKGKAIVTEEQAAHLLLALHTPKSRSTTNQFIFQRWTLAIEASLTGPSAQAYDDTSANIFYDSPSPTDAKTCAASEKTNSGGQARLDPGKTPESRPSPEQVVMDEDQARPNLGESRRALAGPDPEPTHDEFMTDLYHKVQETLKFPVDEHFINDKSTKDELEKPNVEAKVVFMVTVLIYQASSSVPLLSTPVLVIDLSPSKPASSTTQAPIFIATTTSTTTTLLPPPQQ